MWINLDAAIGYVLLGDDLDDSKPPKDHRIVAMRPTSR
jgi:hypothetical protein